MAKRTTKKAKASQKTQAADPVEPTADAACQGAESEAPAAEPVSKADSPKPANRTRGARKRAQEPLEQAPEPAPAPTRKRRKADEAVDAAKEPTEPKDAEEPAVQVCPLASPRSPLSPCSPRTRRRVDIRVTDQPFHATNLAHINLCLSFLNLDPQSGSLPAPQDPAPSASTQQSHAPAGREPQFNQLFDILNDSCGGAQGRSVYISGLPGTGKSHTVRAVVRALQSDERAVAPIAAYISCFSITDPNKIHAAVLNQLAIQAEDLSVHGTADTLKAEEAHTQLTSYLQDLAKIPAAAAGTRSAGGRGKGAGKAKKGAASAGARSAAAPSTPASRLVVIVLDEIDRLLSSRNGLDNMVKLFMLPHAPGVRCCVVAMANSLDITERCLPELKVRGCAPTFIPFAAYMRPQLLAILKHKVSSMPWPVFDDTALELVARKVAASTGDLRKALQACRVSLHILKEQAIANANKPAADAPAPPPAPADTAPTAAAPATATAAPAPAAPATEQGTLGSEPAPEVYTQGETTAAGQDGSSSEGQQAATALRVTVKEMVNALARISYQSDGAASSISAIRNLPQQQQVHLLALATALATAETQAAADAAADAAAAEHGLTASAYRAKYYWGPSTIQKPQVKLSNPFAKAAAAASPGPGGAAGPAGGTPPPPPLSAAKARAGLLAGDAARAVPLSAAYQSYRALCSGLYQQPCSEQEFCSTQQLLSHFGLVNVMGLGGATPGGRRGAGAGAGLASVKLVLKASMRDINTALKDNAVFKKALAVLPA